MWSKCFLVFLLFAAVSFAQVEEGLNKRTDSILDQCLKVGQLKAEQANFFRKIIKGRPAFLRELIDSAYFDFAVILEDYNIRTKSFERSATFIAKGYEELYYKNGKIIRPLPENKGVSDSLSKIILQWPYKIVEPLDPPPVVFSQGKATPSEKLKRKMKKTEEKEKKKGGTEGSVYRIITVVNRVNGKRSVAFFIPRRKIREVIFVPSGK